MKIPSLVYVIGKGKYFMQFFKKIETSYKIRILLLETNISLTDIFFKPLQTKLGLAQPN